MKIHAQKYSSALRRRARHVAIGVAVMAISTVTAFAESSFERGNAAYEAGNYADAAEAYENSIQEGVSGANLYYNLGNTYLRAGEKGRAMLNYQRALALRPGHPEAGANLAFLQRTLNLPPRASTAWNQFVEWLGIDAIAIVAAAGVWILLSGVVAILGPWRRATLGWSLVAVGAFPCVGGLLLLFSLHGGARDPERAIVVSNTGAKAHYAPADNSRDVQLLPAGSEIRLLQDRGSWVYVEVAGGVRGWVAAGAVDTVVPRAAVAPGS